MARKLCIAVIFATFMFGFAGGLLSQEAPPPPPPVDQVFIGAPPPEGGPRHMRGGFEGMPFGVRFLAFEQGLGGKVVTGAPFSAQAVTETVQTLADGNKIDRKTTAQIYRDSQGRTRRETTLAAIGPWGTQGTPPTFTSINDPVAGVGYILDPRTHSATSLPLNSPPQPHQMGRKTGQPGQGQVNSESLGQQVIAGVTAQGTRETMTIPAGAIGNAQPIQIVSERWFSPDLQVVVESTRSDPRFGQTTYQLTNITRTEPAATLFQVPSDYPVKQGRRGFERP